MNTTTATPRNSLRNIGRLVLLTLAGLSIPFIGNWPWTVSDYVIMGVLIMSIGLLYELMARLMRSTRQRVIVASILFLVFILIWGELAVGLFGTPFAGN